MNGGAFSSSAPASTSSPLLSSSSSEVATFRSGTNFRENLRTKFRRETLNKIVEQIFDQQRMDRAHDD